MRLVVYNLSAQLFECFCMCGVVNRPSQNYEERRRDNHKVKRGLHFLHRYRDDRFLSRGPVVRHPVACVRITI